MKNVHNYALLLRIFFLVLIFFHLCSNITKNLTQDLIFQCEKKISHEIIDATLNFMSLQWHKYSSIFLQIKPSRQAKWTQTPTACTTFTSFSSHWSSSPPSTTNLIYCQCNKTPHQHHYGTAAAASTTSTSLIIIVIIINITTRHGWHDDNEDATTVIDVGVLQLCTDDVRPTKHRVLSGFKLCFAYLCYVVVAAAAASQPELIVFRQ